MVATSNKKRSSPGDSTIKFGPVQVREYEVIAGDNPWVKEGPSLSLGWRFVQRDDIDVNQHDEQSQQSSKSLHPLNADTRRFMLAFVFDISKNDIQHSEAVAQIIQQQRQETSKLLQLRRQQKIAQFPAPASPPQKSKRQQYLREKVEQRGARRRPSLFSMANNVMKISTASNGNKAVSSVKPKRTLGRVLGFSRRGQ